MQFKNAFVLLISLFLPTTGCKKSDIAKNSRISSGKHQTYEAAEKHQNLQIADKNDVKSGNTILFEYKQRIEDMPFLDAIQFGLSLIKKRSQSPSELMVLFLEIDDFSKREKLCAELMKSTIKYDFNQSIELASLVPPGKLLQRVYYELACHSEVIDLLEVFESGNKSGLREISTVIKDQVRSRLSMMDEEDLNSFVSDSRSSAFGLEIDQARAKIAFARDGLQPKYFIGDEESSIFRREFLRNSTANDPEETAKWMKNNLAIIEAELLSQPEILETTVCWYLSKSPKDALDWAATFDSKAIAGDAVRSGIDAWLQLDSLAASNWVSSQPTGYVKDVAALAVAQYLARTGDPNGARTWAKSITNKDFGDPVNQLIDSL